MSTIPASGRQAPSRADADRLLTDPRWLAARYAQVGDKVIGRELGVSHARVAEARLRAGIRSLPPGRRRGQTVRVVESRESVLLRIAEQAGREASTGELPTWGAALACFADGDRARRDHDRTRERNAAVALAAAALRLAEHLERLEAA